MCSFILISKLSKEDNIVIKNNLGKKITMLIEAIKGKAIEMLKQQDKVPFSVKLMFVYMVKYWAIYKKKNLVLF